MLNACCLQCMCWSSGTSLIQMGGQNLRQLTQAADEMFGIRFKNEMNLGKKNSLPELVFTVNPSHRNYKACASPSGAGRWRLVEVHISQAPY